MYNFLNTWADVGVPFRPRALQGSVLPKISAVIIAFNEELDIARAIASLAWCDEVLVVDSGSTDGTLAVCEAYGCKVLHRDFIGIERENPIIGRLRHSPGLLIGFSRSMPMKKSPLR